MTVQVRPATSGDHDTLWAILEPIIRTGETFALPQDMDRGAALAYWTGPDRETFVAEDAAGAVLGSYYIRPNQLGGGDHVANCGYATAEAARGRGVARTMCAHSLDHARARGFKAMQFNIVVSTNERAVRLWQSFGFETLARLPGVFRHPTLGAVDALLMFRTL